MRLYLIHITDSFVYHNIGRPACIFSECKINNTNKEGPHNAARTSLVQETIN